MNYDTLLDAAVQSLVTLEQEVDQEIRQEFAEYGNRLDEVVDLLRSVDRSDVHLLISQMGYMHGAVHLGTTCPCVVEARWHACLGRIETALVNAAVRLNAHTVEQYCEELGIPFDGVVDVLHELSPGDGPLPALPHNVVIPDNISGLD